MTKLPIGPWALMLHRSRANQLATALKRGDVFLAKNDDGTERRLISDESLEKAVAVVLREPELLRQIEYLMRKCAATAEQARMWKNRATRKRDQIRNDDFFRDLAFVDATTGKPFNLTSFLNTPAEPPEPTHKLNTDRTVAVATDYFWNEDMRTCPLGAKVQLLGEGGVASYGNYNGRDPFWVAWAPLPKRRTA